MDKGIDKYLEEIGKAQLLSHEEELELIKAVQKKGTDCDEMKQLEESSARFFVSLSCQYKVQGIDTMQLVEAGKEGLRRAALKYDFNTDAKFLPFAVWFMRQEMQKVLKEAVDDVFYERKYLDMFSEGDKSKLMTLANEGDVHAVCVLIKGLNRKEHSRLGAFVDEDTNEEIEILLHDVEEGTTFEKEEGEEDALIQKLLDAKKTMSDEDLKVACDLPIDITPFALELISRGYDNAASCIEDPELLLNLCGKGNKYAARELYHNYMWGNEEHGFFIDKEQAKTYYDMAGDTIEEWELWNDIDDPGEEYPEAHIYELSGDSSILNAVSKLIDELCQRFGTPDNECGLYIPQQALMKTLVGSGSIYYRGNIIRKDFTPEGRLAIKTESDQGEPLLYALRQAFPNLHVEMKEGE